ncbi:hypothetical protein PGTUg99_016024 [Puccinia graminis f. sp. tritici]|uniref:Uncharacterized protein n=1 Tax=Puccinia graminis f. sp. tritici TaxID=56615 RepID=A0A5B0Q7Z2_PUCGR|nr:hypothetical protein PGTUg99_016024 [Puccinia graminis f. sp. tritici]
MDTTRKEPNSLTTHENIYVYLALPTRLVGTYKLRLVWFLPPIPHGFRMTQHAIVGMTTEAHVGEPLDQFSEVGRAASRTKSGTGLFIEPIDHGKLDGKKQIVDNNHEHGNIPEGLEARKVEMQWMVKERNQLWDWIDYLSPPESSRKLSGMKKELAQLHRALVRPTHERVYKMGGHELSEEFLATKPWDSQPAASRANKIREEDKKSYLQSTRDHLQFVKLKAGQRSASSLSQPLLESHEAYVRTPPISPKNHLSSSSPWMPTEAGKPQKILTVFEFALKEKDIPIGDLTMESNLLDGNTLVEGYTDSKIVESFNSLQNKIMGFRSVNRVLGRTEKIFQLKILETCYHLADHVKRYRLLSSEFLNEIELFKAKSVKEMVGLHLQLVLRRWGEQFFDAPNSIVPELEFLTSSPTTAHFHRSIEDQKEIVQIVLNTILMHASDHLPAESKEKESEQFERARKTFLQVNLYERAQGTRAKDTKHHGENQNRSVVNLTRDLIQLFQKPEMSTTNAYRRRIEFQLVYYMLDFLNRHHHRIQKTIEQPEGDYLLLKDQLKFMRSFLGRFRNIYQGQTTSPKNVNTLRKLTKKANSTAG